MKNLDKYALLGNIVVEFAKKGICKIPFQSIYDCVYEFNRLFIVDKTRINLYSSHYDFERFAKRNFTCLHIKEGSNVLEISNSELATLIFNSKYGAEKKFYEKNLRKAVDFVCDKSNEILNI